MVTSVSRLKTKQNRQRKMQMAQLFLSSLLQPGNPQGRGYGRHFRRSQVSPARRAGHSPMAASSLLGARPRQGGNAPQGCGNDGPPHPSRCLCKGSPATTGGLARLHLGSRRGEKAQAADHLPEQGCPEGAHWYSSHRSGFQSVLQRHRFKRTKPPAWQAAKSSFFF